MSKLGMDVSGVKDFLQSYPDTLKKVFHTVFFMMVENDARPTPGFAHLGPRK
jgi:hypothetical protein